MDRLIVAANGLAVFGPRYKPYWLLSDLAMAAAMGFAWMFSIHFPEVSFFGLCAGLVGALVAYKIIREAKAAFGMVAARSFLQDCLLIIIPAFLATNVGFGSPVSFVTAFLGLLMPLYGGIVRIGCFLGGCCYGRRSRNGVLYPRELFESNNSGCRRYAAGPDPGGRVFPIQLVEAMAQLALFVGLAWTVWTWPETARYILPVYLTLYAAIRCALDCFRTASARPRYGMFSEAQLVCVGVMVTAPIALAVLHSS